MPSKNARGFARQLLLFLALAPLSVATAQSVNQSEDQALTNLAKELVVLRAQIESLNAELGDMTAQHRATMNALAIQKGELEASKRREDLRVRELEEDLANNRARAREAGLASEALIPVATSAIDQLKTHVNTGFPFKRAERLAALNTLEDQLATQALTPARVVNRLWGFYEDELRLARENGLYSQTIDLAGESVLADVAKLGVMAMYFETRDGRFGYARLDPDGWRFVEASGGGERQQIKALFDALQKQIRAGLFELPNGSIELNATPREAE